MLSPRLHAVTCTSPAGLHRMAYREWGDPECDEVILCVHGLTRTGRDFDSLASELAKSYRVICPDVVGRGLSDWLLNPAFYALPQYASDMVTLMARVKPKRLHWIGTSMGGLIGLVYAGINAQFQMRNALQTPAQRHTTLPDAHFPLDSLLLNDVGPHIEAVSLERIGQYVGQDVSFDHFDDAVAYVQATCASFGPHTPDQWHELTRHVYIEQSGRWIKHYDLGIASAFKQMTPQVAAQAETLLWAAFASLKIPVQIIRGQQSDLLSEQTCHKMLQTQAHAQLSQIQGVGHAPTLMDRDQISIVTDFLKNQCHATPCDSRG